MSNLNGLEGLIVNYIKSFVKLVYDIEGVKFRRILVEFDDVSYESRCNGLVMKGVIVNEKASCESEKE